MGMTHAGHPSFHDQVLCDLLLLGVIRVSQDGRHQLIGVVSLHFFHLLTLIPVILWRPH